MEESPSTSRKSLMENLLGLLRVRVKRGVNLAVRDVRSSDPYVVIKMYNQVNFQFFYNFFIITIIENSISFSYIYLLTFLDVDLTNPFIFIFFDKFYSIFLLLIYWIKGHFILFYFFEKFSIVKKYHSIFLLLSQIVHKFYSIFMLLIQWIESRVISIEKFYSIFLLLNYALFILFYELLLIMKKMSRNWFFSCWHFFYTGLDSCLRKSVNLYEWLNWCWM